MISSFSFDSYAMYGAASLRTRTMDIA
jgi:hypothetical protein